MSSSSSSSPNSGTNFKLGLDLAWSSPRVPAWPPLVMPTFTRAPDGARMSLGGFTQGGARSSLALVWSTSAPSVWRCYSRRNRGAR